MADLNKLVNDYFSGSKKDEIFNKIREIFESGKGEEELRHIMKDQWRNLQDEDLSPCDLTPVLNRMHHIINRSGKGKTKYRHILTAFIKIAAGIMLPLLVASIWISYNYYQKQKSLLDTWTEIAAPGGSRVNFTLPDGTNGWLNGYSSISFPLQFGDERRIKVSGEVYLDVSHDTNKPFFVDIPAFSLRVLGTQFSVTAFEEDNTSEVVLESGSVSVMNNIKNKELILSPDQHLIINNITGVYNIQEINARNFTSWKDGFLIFRNDPMTDVVTRLSRWYNVDMELKDKQLYEYRFRATFKDESLEDVLSLLKLSSPIIDYSVSDRKMQENGQFSRRKVTLYLKKGKAVNTSVN